MVASMFSAGSEPTDTSADTDHTANGARRPAARPASAPSKSKLTEKLGNVGRLAAAAAKSVTPRKARRKPGLLAGLDDVTVRRALAFDEPVTSGGRTDLIPDRA